VLSRRLPVLCRRATMASVRHFGVIVHGYFTPRKWRVLRIDFLVTFRSN
jgi:hypothetical protein